VIGADEHLDPVRHPVGLEFLAERRERFGLADWLTWSFSSRPR